ncbi:hypothetical protein CapIbe_015575 [Capra ibex]
MPGLGSLMRPIHLVNIPRGWRSLQEVSKYLQSPWSTHNWRHSHRHCKRTDPHPCLAAGLSSSEEEERTESGGRVSV